MKLTSASFTDGARIPGEFAFCLPADEGHVCLGANRNPQLAWSEVPAGTKSFVLICHDPDVPSRGDDVNQEGRSVPAGLPRVDFFHWVLIDLPGDRCEIAAGEFSSEVTPGGKPGPDAPLGARQGINDYTGWFASDHDMSGDYYGYDGPCPPWNDSIVHHYEFTVFALDIDHVPVEGSFTCNDLLGAVDDMGVREDRAVGVHDEAGADAALGPIRTLGAGKAPEEPVEGRWNVRLRLRGHRRGPRCDADVHDGVGVVPHEGGEVGQGARHRGAGVLARPGRGGQGRLVSRRLGAPQRGHGCAAPGLRQSGAGRHGEGGDDDGTHHGAVLQANLVGGTLGRAH